MMCDQLNARILGCYGGPVPTPNLDRLAREGVTFSNATCPTPFCSPSRASLITGLYPHTHGIVYNVNRRDYPAISAPPTEEGIKRGDVTTEGFLNAIGYDTHHYGKWHLADEDLSYYQDMFGEHHQYGQSMAETFEQVRRLPREKWMEWYGWALPVEVAPELQEAVADLGDRWDDKPYAEFVTKMGRLEFPLNQNFDVQVTDRGVDRLGQVARDPFMVTCSFNYPHDPNVAPSPHYDAFEPARLGLPDNFESRGARFDNEWSRQIVTDLGDAGAREFLRIYYASVKLVDDQVGRVLDALEATGHSDDTIVVFTADHGDMAGGHGMVWKSTSCFYDDVARIPLIVRYPARINAGQSEIAAGLTDIMPTLLELVGQPIPQHIEGHSLAPYLLGERDPNEAPAYTFCERVAPNPQHTRVVAGTARAAFMVRGEGWKYFVYPDGGEFLYDLEEDPHETRNLAGDARFESRKAELREELDRWLAETAYSGSR